MKLLCFVAFVCAAIAVVHCSQKKEIQDLLETEIIRKHKDQNYRATKQAAMTQLAKTVAEQPHTQQARDETIQAIGRLPQLKLKDVVLSCILRDYQRKQHPMSPELLKEIEMMKLEDLKHADVDAWKEENRDTPTKQQIEIQRGLNEEIQKFPVSERKVQMKHVEPPKPADDLAPELRTDQHLKTDVKPLVHQEIIAAAWKLHHVTPKEADARAAIARDPDQVARKAKLDTEIKNIKLDQMKHVPDNCPKSLTVEQYKLLENTIAKHQALVGTLDQVVMEMNQMVSFFEDLQTQLGQTVNQLICFVTLELYDEF